MSERNEDVMEFINSLPDSKSGTPKPEGKEDLLEFLDELAAHEKKPLKLEPKAKAKDEALAESKPKATATAKGAKDKSGTKATATGDKAPAEVPKTPTKARDEAGKDPSGEESLDSANKELEIDPLNSITNWWNKEGATTVSNLWGSITNNASTLSESTYKLASDTTNQINNKRQEFLKEQEEHGGKSFDQINTLTTKLNGIFVNITDQISLLNSEDELINVITVNDFKHLDYLNDVVYKNFNKVMSQVEGGIKVNVNSYNNYHEDSLPASQVDLNMFNGKLLDGEKLCMANLDSSIKNFTKMLEFETKEQTEINEKMKLINKSNVFISFQAINNLTNLANESEDSEIVVEQNDSKSFVILMVLHDTTNKIVIKTKSQAFPLVWSQWLKHENLEQFEDYEDIDPKEWVKDWIKQGVNLSVGIMAQQYVVKRMGFNI